MNDKDSNDRNVDNHDDAVPRNSDNPKPATTPAPSVDSVVILVENSATVEESGKEPQQQQHSQQQEQQPVDTDLGAEEFSVPVSPSHSQTSADNGQHGPDASDDDDDEGKLSAVKGVHGSSRGLISNFTERRLPYGITHLPPDTGEHAPP